MKSLNIKKIGGIASLGLAVLMGVAVTGNAQTWKRDTKQEQKVEKQQAKLAAQRAKIEQQRLKLEQQRLRSQHNNGVFANNNNSNRFRVFRNGSYYNTDSRGADLLRQAVNAGYQQGFNAGKADRNNRRGSNWNNSNVYRSGTFGYQSYVDRGQYQYYFQQGFQKGYQDGYNSRWQYGSNSNGGVSILGTILNQLLNVQKY